MKKQCTELSWILLVGALLAGSGNTAAQTITTIAGTGVLGYGGDGGLATAATVNNPRGLAVDAAGNIYIADVNNAVIREINTSGVITTVAGTGVAGYSGDGGAAVSAQLNGPQAVAVTASGNLIIADTQNRRIRMVNSFGTITTIAGTGVEGYSGDGGLATQAMFHQAMDLAVDASGNIYFADSTGQRIRKISTSGIITTVAGNGTAGYSGDTGPAPFAELNFPVSVALDSSNDIYIADGNNFRIREVFPVGTIVTVAGNGTEGFSGDGGAATSAEINYVYGVRLDSSGNLYIADASNNRVRKVTNGTINTVAGTGINGFSGDGSLAIDAMLNFPWFLALNTSGNLLISDSQNDRVRMVTLVTTTLPPVLSPGGTVNAASYAAAVSANGAISPGSIVAIFGSNLATAAVGASGIPLPTSLGSTTVTMNGTAVPLFYVSNGQVNAQVPYGMASGSVSLQVQSGSQSSTVQTASVVSASPGVFSVNSNGNGTGVFLHANYQTINANSPAQPGETILIYCTGLGATNPAVTTGNAAPTIPVANTVIAPTVTIGGISSFVSFSGLAPGFVGLYQINAQVPPGIGAGTPQVIVQINGVQSNVTSINTN
jgi:uncharacterized protein (TIGR03437 family)